MTSCVRCGRPRSYMDPPYFCETCDWDLNGPGADAQARFKLFCLLILLPAMFYGLAQILHGFVK